jgi:hypothetical protein
MEDHLKQPHIVKYSRTCDAPGCHQPINVGDAIATTHDGDTVHEDCWDAYAKDQLGFEEGIAE